VGGQSTHQAGRVLLSANNCNYHCYII